MSLKSTKVREVFQGIGALVLLATIVAGLLYGLSFVLTGTVGGAIVAGLIGLGGALASRAFEHKKQREFAIAEKKREVYRRLLAPWEHMMVEIKAGKQGDDLLGSLDLAAVYSSAFDAVLYGSEPVVQRFVDFRSPTAERDGIDTLRALAALLVAMREDVTGKKTALSVESVLGTFMNFTEEERVLLRLRDYVATHPEAQRKLAEALSSGQQDNASSTAKPTS